MQFEDMLITLQELDGLKFPLFADAIKVFNEYQYPDYIDSFIQVANDITHETPQEALALFENICLNELISVIAMHGVQVDESLTIRDAIEILEGLLAIEHTENIEECLDLIKAHPLPTDALAELMGAAKLKFPDNFLRHITYVEKELINNIFEMLYTKAHHHGDIEELAETDISTQVDNYKKLKVLYNESGIGETLYCDMYTEHTEQIGLPYNTYIEFYKAMFVHRLMSTDKKVLIQVIYEIAGFMCLSQEGLQGLMPMVNTLVDELIADLGKKKIVAENLSALLQRIAHGKI